MPELMSSGSLWADRQHGWSAWQRSFPRSLKESRDETGCNYITLETKPYVSPGPRTPSPAEGPGAARAAIERAPTPLARETGNVRAYLNSKYEDAIFAGKKIFIVDY
jgi:hypothetical protein